MNETMTDPARVVPTEPTAKRLPIGREEIAKATTTLLRYKDGKKVLETRLHEEDKWYRMRHWEVLKNSGELKPTSGWLFNTLANKHADAMDNFPSANILPREEGDKAEAKLLSAILPVIYDQANFEQVYNDLQDTKGKSGTGVYGVFWDKSKLNGMGDITISQVNLMNLFWQPGITDIQKSRHVFCIEWVDNEQLLEEYPETKDHLGQSALRPQDYTEEDKTNYDNKSVVVDWYYKKRNAAGKQILHYCKYVNDVVLYATENDTTVPTAVQVDPVTLQSEEVPVGNSIAESGLYDHGMYPFVFDVLFRQENSVAGFGYVAVGKSAQEFIDRGNQAIMENMLANASGRLIVKDNVDIKAEDVADYTKKVIRAGQGFNADQVMQLTNAPLDNAYLSAINQKIDELKETTGNRDVSNGGTSGVTAASAIAAMQEAGSKLARDSNKGSYRAFRAVTTMVIELIRQFYDVQRQYRIVGENGQEMFVGYSNANIKMQTVSGGYGGADGYRLPLFDIEVVAQKASPYSKMSQNELALQFFGAGFFNPALADQALMCLDMMDFDRKDFIMQKIAQNSQIYQFMQMLSMGQMPMPGMGGQASADGQAALGDERVGESSVTENARKRTAEATAPV